MDKRVITLLVTGLLVHAASSTASASEVQGSIQVGGGPLLATGLPELSVSGMGVIGFGVTWPVSGAMRIGVRQELAFTTIPYGHYDGEPVIGEEGFESNVLQWAPTFIPSTTLWLKLEPSARVSFDASLGVATSEAPGGRRATSQRQVAQSGLCAPGHRRASGAAEPRGGIVAERS